MKVNWYNIKFTKVFKYIKIGEKINFRDSTVFFYFLSLL